jgi:hypothetical protein
VIIITDEGFRNKYSAVLNLRLQVVLIAANALILLCIATYLQTNSDYAHREGYCIGRRVPIGKAQCPALRI